MPLVAPPPTARLLRGGGSARLAAWAAKRPRDRCAHVCHSSNSSSSSTTTTVSAAAEWLTLEVTGFQPAAALEACPGLAQLSQQELEVQLSAVRALLPERILGATLTRHPQLLLADLAAWTDFLTAFTDTTAAQQHMREIARSSPDVFYRASIFSAGQLLLFLRQDLQLEDEQLFKQLRLAAVLGPTTTQDGMREVARVLLQHLDRSTELQEAGGPEAAAAVLLPLLQTFPGVLGLDAAADVAPRLAFLESLGRAGQQQLAGSLWDADTRWLPGLASWDHTVAPKLQLLADTLGDEEQARQLVSRCPVVLRLAVESKLRPLLHALSGRLGLDGGQVASLLRDCPRLLAEPREALVGRANFLLDAIGASPSALLEYPGYLLLPLEDHVGPRFYMLARRPGWVDALSDQATGCLQLRRVMEPLLPEFLATVAAATGCSEAEAAAEYEAAAAEWGSMFGWCAEKAWCQIDDLENSLYAEQVNLFYMMTQ